MTEKTPESLGTNIVQFPKIKNPVASSPEIQSGVKVHFVNALEIENYLNNYKKYISEESPILLNSFKKRFANGEEPLINGLLNDVWQVISRNKLNSEEVVSLKYIGKNPILNGLFIDRVPVNNLQITTGRDILVLDVEKIEKGLPLLKDKYGEYKIAKIGDKVKIIQGKNVIVFNFTNLKKDPKDAINVDRGEFKIIEINYLKEEGKYKYTIQYISKNFAEHNAEVYEDEIELI